MTDGRDERQCLRLNKHMRGSNGEGRLEAWSAVSNKWKTVCGEKWDSSYMSNRACRRLGYKKANHTVIKDESKQQLIESRVGEKTQFDSKTYFYKGRVGEGERNWYDL